MGAGAGQSQMFAQRAPLMAERSYDGKSSQLATFTIYLDLIEAELRRLRNRCTACQRRGRALSTGHRGRVRRQRHGVHLRAHRAPRAGRLIGGFPNNHRVRENNKDDDARRHRDRPRGSRRRRSGIQRRLWRRRAAGSRSCCWKRPKSSAVRRRCRSVPSWRQERRRSKRVGVKDSPASARAGSRSYSYRHGRGRRCGAASGAD